MSVAICIDSVAADAGTEKYVVEIVRRLDRARFDLHLCCLEDSPQLKDLASCCSTQVFPARSLYRPNGVWQVRKLRHYFRQHGIEVVHTFMPKATAFGVLAARRSGCRAVIASRRNMGYWHTPFTRCLFRYLNRHTTRILANSERVKEHVVQAEGVSPEHIDVLYNGVDMAPYEPGRSDPSAALSLGILADAPVVGVVANYRAVKGLDLFLNAAQIVARQVPAVVFLLVGQGPLREELGRQAQELGIAGRVFFTGGKGAVPDYLGRMSVACLSSHSEGFSNALLEYMAAGVPAVATDAGGNAEAIEHGRTGFVVAGRDPDKFAARVIELLENEDQRAGMARQSRERCRERFEIGEAMRRLAGYYEALVERASGADRSLSARDSSPRSS